MFSCSVNNSAAFGYLSRRVQLVHWTQLVVARQKSFVSFCFDLVSKMCLPKIFRGVHNLGVTCWTCDCELQFAS